MEPWPELPYDEWRLTRDTLHMYAQVLGKLRLKLSPFEPGWANVPLYVTARGLTTSPLPDRLRAFDAELDLLGHELVLRSSDGAIERRALGGAVADFERDVLDDLRRMGFDVRISELPSEVVHPIRFSEDRAHHTYVPDQAVRFFTALSSVDIVMKEFRAGFNGRTSPVQFFWGSFDLALTRYSGQPAPVQTENAIRRFSSEREEYCAGWWPGDERWRYPAFYAYAHAAPPGIGDIPLRPSEAVWDGDAGLFLLRYDTVRSSPDPRRSILDFLHSTYDGVAALQGWSGDLTTFPVPAASGG